MGKRSTSTFERREADFYATPAPAVVPLVAHLRAGRIRRFAEPCSGSGDLIRHLEAHGLVCAYSSDIRAGQDALALTLADINGAPVVTNPPFSRESQPLLRRLIVHFLRIAPMAWLLLPADFASNRWFAPFLPQCSDIVPIGRVRWFAGTKGNSYENFAWYRFDACHSVGPVFHARGSTPARTRACDKCRKAYEPQRSSSRFCSPACKQSAWRKRLSVTLAVTSAPAAPLPGGVP